MAMYFTKGEEQANFISHLIGASLSLAGLVVLIIFAVLRGSGIHVVSATIFGATMLLVYLSSTLFHGLKTKKAKNTFFLFDQIAIYLLIAGSYTPISLIVVQGTLGWVMFSIEWGLAALGIIYTILTRKDYEEGVGLFKVTFYAIMGWLLIIAIKPLMETLSKTGFILLITGGAFYFLGILFFTTKKIKYTHLIWHLFVLLGSACHYIMIFKDVLIIPI